MTLEDIRWSCDNFPVGMRVLAVDDNPTCLMLLEGLLKKCQYQVTTTSQARIALKMLRENKDRFDLVISDVQMPDMDGFKLLELVGLEMDLPVIMLSGNGDNKLVLKGIIHGACDYMLKPVRLEELKNIWQHVVRKKKVHPKNLSKSEDQDKDHQGKEPQLSEQNKQLNKKRKEEEEYESDENGNDSDDTTTQKKPRVVWSIELHRKFVAAVNQLGLEKAVPKRILDLMNVEGITRENVASHLQKYRLYLKKTSQQASMVAAFGGKDSAYVRMGSLDGLSSFRTLAGSGRFGQQPTLSSSYTSAGAMLSSRLNSAAGLGLHNLTSSLQPNHGRTLTNSSNALMKLNPNVPHSVLNGSLFQGIPPSLELDQLQQHKHGLNPLCNVSNNPTLLQPLTGAGFGNQQSLNIATFSSDSFNSGVSGSSDYLDHGSGNENWHSSIQSLKFQSSSFPLTQPFINTHLAQDRVRDDYTLAGPQLQNSTINFSSSTTVLSSPFEVSRGETQRHESLGGAALPSQMWQDQISNNFFGNMSSQVPGNGVMVSVTHNTEQNNETFGRKVDLSLIGRSNGGSLGIIQHSESENLTPDLRTRTNEDHLLEATKQHIGFLPRDHDSLDDLVSAMKREQDGSILEGGDFGFDAYSFVSGI